MTDTENMATQVLLVVAALISVPIMLLPKPLVLQKRFKERQKQLEEYGRVSPHDEDEESQGNGALRMAPPAHEHEEEFDFSEVIVHQVRLLTVLSARKWIQHDQGSLGWARLAPQ